MQSKDDQNSHYQNLSRTLWPASYTQKFTLQNGLVMVFKRRQDSNPLNLITLFAESIPPPGQPPIILGEAGLFGPLEKAQFSILVREEYRGLGLGKKFFQLLVALARTLGITSFTHIPVSAPSGKVLEKLQQLKWLRLEYDPQGQVRIHCQFNQRMRM